MEKYIDYISDWVVYGLLNLEAGSRGAEALQYFLTGFSFITILVILISYLMGYVTSYMSIDKVRYYLEKNKKFGLGNLMASMLGAVTPFCSCSSIPLFVGMMQSRIPLGIALSFLITSPLVNEIAIALFIVSFGWQVALMYIATGILLGVFGGMLLEKMGMAKYVADWVQTMAKAEANEVVDDRGLLERFPQIHLEVKATLKRLIPYVFIGLVAGSFIHGYVPLELIEKHLSTANWYTVPLAVLAAIPLYIDSVGILPVVESLIGQGVPIGTAMAFMMAAVGLSLPEGLLLKKVMKKELLFAFFGTIGLGMILSGFLFNTIFA